MAKFSAALADFIDGARQQTSYWVEVAKLDFALSLEAKRRQSGLSYGTLAKKLGTSAAYISKVFRGDSNLTIESMVKLANATGGRLELKIVDAAAESATPVHWNLSRIPPAVDGISMVQTRTAASATAASVQLAMRASNHERFNEALAA